MTTATLSPEAIKVLNYLKTTGGAWIQKCIEAIYPEPKYIGTLDPNFDNEVKSAAQLAHWQWDANLYGNDQKRPVLGVHRDVPATANYYNVVSAAYKELRLAGLAGESNNGMNEYWIYPIK